MSFQLIPLSVTPLITTSRVVSFTQYVTDEARCVQTRHHRPRLSVRCGKHRPTTDLVTAPSFLARYIRDTLSPYQVLFVIATSETVYRPRLSMKQYTYPVYLTGCPATIGKNHGQNPNTNAPRGIRYHFMRMQDVRSEHIVTCPGQVILWQPFEQPTTN